MAADLPGRADIVIVGAGPAGLAAAAELARLRAGSVLVLDREAAAGGVPRHCGHSPFGLREFGRPLLGPAYARRLAATATAAGADTKTGITVTALLPGPRLRVTSQAGTGEIEAGLVLLATGTREASRSSRLIGGTKPGGVMTTGALQALAYGAGLRPFRRPVIAGSELVAFSALLTCRHLGIRPAALVEAGPRGTARFPAALLPRLLGVPFLTRSEVVGVEGRERVEAVIVHSAGRDSRLAADGLVMTGHFRPEAALAAASHLAVDPATGGPEVDEFARCSDPAYFAAGNLLRPVETAGWCWAEGRAVARAMARALTGGLPAPGGERISLTGAPLKYVVPQRIVAGPSRRAALRRLQLRLVEPARGRLVIEVAGARVADKALDSLPERRILIALPAPDGPVRIGVEDRP